jgi:cyclopropane fatty-acyl-phospholipid synthase-like methyltransferase
VAGLQAYEHFMWILSRFIAGIAPAPRAVGLNDSVEIRPQDRRDERECYDRIVSFEMVEAVGEGFSPTYAVMPERIFGQDYAKTPATWRNNFCSARINLRQVVFAKSR